MRRREKRLARFNTSAPERKHGGVAAIVQDHVAGLVARTPIEDALYIIPIFLKGLTLYGENGNALSRNGSGGVVLGRENITRRSEEHTSELQSLMRISYAVFCLKKKNTTKQQITSHHHKSTHNKKT